MKITVTLRDDLWLWHDAGAGYQLMIARARPGAYTPRPTVLRAGTEVDLEVWHPGCKGCEAIREMQRHLGGEETVTVEHTHGRP